MVGTLPGRELEYVVTQHPFLDRESLVILGDHVTLEIGYRLCTYGAGPRRGRLRRVQKELPQLPIVVPVDSKGRMTKEAGEQFAGLSTDEANKAIAAELEQRGALFAMEKIHHDYPHCWRCKKPVLFRATEQWFCSVEQFKEQAVKAIEDVTWTPAWGQDRITSMVRDRADWCISRQRKWGVPIPIVYCKDCGKPIVTKESIEKIASVFRMEGSDSWFVRDAADFLPEGFVCPECGSKNFEKEKDIMDVWFDSGVSHAACLTTRETICSGRQTFTWKARTSTAAGSSPLC